MSFAEEELTDEERSALRSLRRLAKRWPKSLWLFSASGTLHVMRTGPNGKRVMRRDTHLFASGEADPEVTDQRASIGTIDIPNDGGDW